jgi:hypothetical protein
MTFTPEQIELIVQRVVQTLGMTNGAPAPTKAAVAVQPAAAPVVHLPGPVITQDILVGAARGAVDVSIDAKAILTPSARDYVRQQGIKIVRESAPAPVGKTVVRWQALVTRSTPQIAAALEGISSVGIACDLRLMGVPAEAAAQAVSALCRGEAQQIVVFTDQPELVACLANRNDRVRAAAASEMAAVERIRRHLQANLLALDPTDKSVHELKSLLKAYCVV